MKKYIYKCPYCERKYIAPNKEDRSHSKKLLYNHIEKQHSSLLGGMSPAQAYFNFKYNKTYGSCIICKKPTKWNESVERYDRLCSEECKKIYNEKFKKNMEKKYGKDIYKRMRDPEVQSKMLSKRKISGEYIWSDKKSKTNYTGKYEKDFLEFLDLVLKLNPLDVFAPCPHVFEYIYDNKKHFYLPDFYILSLNLIIEIKDGGSNPNNHPKIQAIDKVKEKLKDEVMKNQKKFNYLKIEDKDYSILINYLIDLKYQEE